MTTLSFVSRLRDGMGGGIFLYRGTSASGKAFFAYIACRASGAEQLEDDYKTGAMQNINAYGRVITMGFLPEPDEKAKAFIADYMQQVAA